MGRPSASTHPKCNRRRWPKPWTFLIAHWPRPGKYVSGCFELLIYILTILILSSSASNIEKMWDLLKSSEPSQQGDREQQKRHFGGIHAIVKVLHCKLQLPFWVKKPLDVAPKMGSCHRMYASNKELETILLLQYSMAPTHVLGILWNGTPLSILSEDHKHDYQQIIQPRARSTISLMKQFNNIFLTWRRFINKIFLKELKLQMNRKA